MQASGEKAVLEARVESWLGVDPGEIAEMRDENEHLDRSTFEEIARSLRIAFPQGTATYEEFIDHVQA